MLTAEMPNAAMTKWHNAKVDQNSLGITGRNRVLVNSTTIVLLDPNAVDPGLYIMQTLIRR